LKQPLEQPGLIARVRSVCFYFLCIHLVLIVSVSQLHVAHCHTDSSIVSSFLIQFIFLFRCCLLILINEPAVWWSWCFPSVCPVIWIPSAWYLILHAVLDIFYSGILGENIPRTTISCLLCVFNVSGIVLL
jgi:hypothetical protein